jgi:hypothetical protein
MARLLTEQSDWQRGHPIGVLVIQKCFVHFHGSLYDPVVQLSHANGLMSRIKLGLGVLRVKPNDEMKRNSRERWTPGIPTLYVSQSIPASVKYHKGD